MFLELVNTVYLLVTHEKILNSSKFFGEVSTVAIVDISIVVFSDVPYDSDLNIFSLFIYTKMNIYVPNFYFSYSI